MPFNIAQAEYLKILDHLHPGNYPGNEKKVSWFQIWHIILIGSTLSDQKNLCRLVAAPIYVAYIDEAIPVSSAEQ